MLNFRSDEKEAKKIIKEEKKCKAFLDRFKANRWINDSECRDLKKIVDALQSVTDSGKVGKLADWKDYADTVDDIMRKLKRQELTDEESDFLVAMGTLCDYAANCM